MLIVVVVGDIRLRDWRGLNSLPLPGTEGSGPGSFVIQAQTARCQQHPAELAGAGRRRHRRQRHQDRAPGLACAGHHALNGDVDLPANATAKIGQTSLLGSLHIELAPPTDVPPQGKLHDGSLIPLSHGGAYPTTEQTLAALSMVLNGGGLGQVQDITEAFSTAFRGREQDLRSLIEQLDKFTAHLNDQTGDIIAATDSLNSLVGQFAAQKPVLDRALRPSPTRWRCSTTSATTWPTRSISSASSAR